MVSWFLSLFKYKHSRTVHFLLILDFILLSTLWYVVISIIIQLKIIPSAFVAFCCFSLTLGLSKGVMWVKISILCWISGHPFVVISWFVIPCGLRASSKHSVALASAETHSVPWNMFSMHGKNCIVQPDKLRRKWHRKVSHALSDSLFPSYTGWLPRGDVGVSRYTVDPPFLPFSSASYCEVVIWTCPILPLACFLFLASWSSWKYPAAAGRPLWSLLVPPRPQLPWALLFDAHLLHLVPSLLLSGFLCPYY